MVEQVIKFSDGTETVIKYRGVIRDGVLISEKLDESMSEEPEVSETSKEPETPVEEVSSAEESESETSG